MALSEKKVNKKVKENIKNIPNLLTLIRILMSFFLIFLVFDGAGIWTLAVVFAAAALTDAADGFIARRFKMETNFGRVFDITADRVLMISVVISLISYMIINSLLTQQKLILILLLISREIISLPFFLLSLFLKHGKPFPHVRFMGKLTTLLQGVSLPMIILGWQIAVIFAFLTAIIGVISGIIYAKDSVLKPRK